jgi:hypothetical protein
MERGLTLVLGLALALACLGGCARRGPAPPASAAPAYYYGYPCCGSATTNVYGHGGATSFSGTQTWYASSSGTYGVAGSGSYTNARTGTPGTYSTHRGYNPWTGQQSASLDRSFDTARGTTGTVSRDASYNWQTGQGSYDASVSAQGPGGTTATHDVSASTGEGVRGGGWQPASGDTSWADREQQARGDANARFGGFRDGGLAERSPGGFGGREGVGGGFGGRFGGGGFRGGRR